MILGEFRYSQYPKIDYLESGKIRKKGVGACRPLPYGRAGTRLFAICAPPRVL